MKTKIYILKDPDTKEIRYVGKTIQSLKKRLSGHLTKAKFNRTTHVSCWIFQLLQNDKKPIIELLEVTDNWILREQYWISKFENLCNHSIGGESGTLGYKLTSAHKSKISKSLMNRERPHDVKVKISNSHKGKVLSESTKQKLRIANLGKKQCLNTRLKGAKVVQQFDKDGHLIKEYFSLGYASEKTGFPKGNLSSACVGRLKTAYGYVWKYKHEDIVQT